MKHDSVKHIEPVHLGSGNYSLIRIIMPGVPPSESGEHVVGEGSLFICEGGCFDIGLAGAR